jgi:hypothetical protein
LRLVLCALACFIRSFKPSKTRLSMIFTYPLTKLFEIQWTSQHGTFSFYCHIGVCDIFEEVI